MSAVHSIFSIHNVLFGAVIFGLLLARLVIRVRQGALLHMSVLDLFIDALPYIHTTVGYLRLPERWEGIYFNNCFAFLFPPGVMRLVISLNRRAGMRRRSTSGSLLPIANSRESTAAVIN